MIIGYESSGLNPYNDYGNSSRYFLNNDGDLQALLKMLFSLQNMNFAEVAIHYLPLP